MPWGTPERGYNGPGRPVRRDKYGNKQFLAPCYRKDGSGWYRGYAEINGKLFKVTVNPEVVTEGKRGDPRIWVSITEPQRGGGNYR